MHIKSAMMVFLLLNSIYHALIENFHNLPSDFSKMLVFFITDNEHVKFFLFFVSHVITWNFLFLM